MKNYSVQISVYLYCLIPLALLTGPFFPDLFITIIGLTFLFNVINEKNWFYFKNQYFYFFLIFFIYINLCSIISDYKIFSLSSSLVYFRYGLFALATWYLLDVKKEFFQYFKYALLITFIYALCDGYYQYFFGSSFFGQNSIEESRLSLPFDDKLILGGYLARLFPLLIALLIFDALRSKENFIILAFLLILTDILVYLSGERTALGLLFITTLCLIIFLSKFKILRILTFIVSIICIVIISYINPNIKERNVDVTLSQLGIDDNSKKVNIFSPQHESHYIGAWKLFLDNPVFGAGPNNYRNHCNDPKFSPNIMTCSTHPHNTYIQLLAETGLIGFLAISSVIIIIAVKLSKHFYYMYLKNKLIYDDYQICLMICFILSLFPFLPTLNFFNNWINIIYFLPVGFYLNSVYNTKGTDNVES